MNQSEKKELPDFMMLYQHYHQLLTNGARAELRRISLPSELVKVPAFYRLTVGFGTGENIQRLGYCLPYIKPLESGKNLGQALAEAKIREKRLFMVIRSQSPNDLIQLRRLLQQVEPTVNWVQAAKQIYYWNDLAKRQLLENYFLHLNEPAKKVLV